MTGVSSIPTTAQLQRLDAVMNGAEPAPHDGAVRVGVDLGTAYTVVVVTDDAGEPLAGASEFTEVVRDGVVVDFHGAIAAVKRLSADVEGRLGRPLTRAAAGYPPGVSSGSVAAVRNVLEGAGLECTGLVDEPTAANAVLGVEDGAIVDVGGGTTGIAIVRGGDVATVEDEATGGTHLSLVLAGALGLSLEQAEAVKRDPQRRDEVTALVRPVLEKIAAIVSKVISGTEVRQIALAGGTCRLPAVADVIAEVTGLPVDVPVDPLYVTSLGLALHDQPGDG